MYYSSTVHLIGGVVWLGQPKDWHAPPYFSDGLGTSATHNCRNRHIILRITPERYVEELRRRTIPMRACANMRSAERIISGIIADVLNNEPEMPDPPAEVVRRAGTQFTQLA